MLTRADNRYRLLAFNSLRPGMWKDNPTGMFSIWNPSVSCARPEGAEQQTTDLVLPNG
jgi:hypothetical protein